VGGRVPDYPSPPSQTPRGHGCNDGDVTLDDIAAELYGVPPGEFTPARNARAKELAAAGERALAAEVRKLAKPSVAAWTLNMLVRSHRAEVSELVGLGSEIRHAQGRGARDDMRRLAARRRELVDALLERASETAATGRATGPNVRRQVQQSLEAAVADEASATALLAGRLSDPLLFVGFGDGSSTTRGDDRPRFPSRPRARSRPPREPVRNEAAARALADADRVLARAQAELESAVSSLAEARYDDDAASAHLDRARTALHEAEDGRARSRKALQRARQAITAARRQVADAERGRRACQAGGGAVRKRGVAPD
jgi:hypothetical protein